MTRLGELVTLLSLWQNTQSLRKERFIWLMVSVGWVHVWLAGRQSIMVHRPGGGKLRNTGQPAQSCARNRDLPSQVTYLVTTCNWSHLLIACSAVNSSTSESIEYSIICGPVIFQNPHLWTHETSQGHLELLRKEHLEHKEASTDVHLPRVKSLPGWFLKAVFRKWVKDKPTTAFL